MIAIALWLMAGMVAAQDTPELTRGPDGFIDRNGGCGTVPGGKICTMKSLEYPNPSPENVTQWWSFLSAGEDMKTALRIKCSDVFIAQETPCYDNSFWFKDGKKKIKYCGNVGSLDLLTKNEYVTFTFQTGSQGGGRLNCQVWAVQVDETGKEIGTEQSSEVNPAHLATYDPTKGGLPYYLLAGSDERDSFEHGIGPDREKTTCKCGWTNKRVVARIVNGEEAHQNEFPWAVAIVDPEPEEGEPLFSFCGGSIISEWHVLTAAHCTADFVMYNITLGVVVGAHKIHEPIDGTTRMILVEKIVQHENYTPQIKQQLVFKNDISLLVLSEKITFTSLVGPVCLPTKPMSRILGYSRDYIKIMGWGTLYVDGPKADVLKKVDVRAVPPEECSFMVKIVDSSNPSQICTYRENKSGCQGDSGGPVVWLDPETNRYTQVGLVSFGRVCADITPTVHSDVGYFLPWIYANIEKNKKADTCYKK